ncbi:uncharacterized protein FFB20_07820 [Fusarium fujikuroi]|uniref:Uncharacterized protein n=2 Tax=Fusarium fujikuroi TaxID=5127 RepID=S0DT71_GIBF5|nr:uncharacterized protein FFUJ_02561 [Fusarium fujikuroi IMI 58289]KLP08149.1 uncharacterized protein Y057_11692 [Fusarium fujikuroi]KLP10820.1 uncharacterized protein LW94_8395 [Fusarium fujikuroi]QGI61771.1 hypothetical protein CEK27_005742 [Fusarium fujikuroi]QGI78957.1 hypothetical protein CEK25_005686 [Fusarium fujikuroi]QGI92670.1 hypothetical protein CEK26_005739 [Fusarium fujikuroi]
MITTLQKPFSQSRAVLCTGASVFSRLSRFHIANPLARFPERQWQRQTRGLRTRYRPPPVTPPLRVQPKDEKFDKLMASLAGFEQEYKAAGSIKQRIAATHKGNQAISEYLKSLFQTGELEDLKSLAQRISKGHKNELRNARTDGAATCLAFILSLYFIILLVEAAKSSVSEDEKEPTKPESQSLEEKDTPQAGSTKTYRRKTNKFETEAPGIKCMCHRPLELDNTRVL